jgi:hypothetical protein
MGPLHGIKNMTYVLVPFCKGFVHLCPKEKVKREVNLIFKKTKV